MPSWVGGRKRRNRGRNLQEASAKLPGRGLLARVPSDALCSWAPTLREELLPLPTADRRGLAWCFLMR